MELPGKETCQVSGGDTCEEPVFVEDRIIVRFTEQHLDKKVSINMVISAKICVHSSLFLSY